MYLQELANARREVHHNTYQSMPSQPCVHCLRLAVLPAFGSKWLLPRLKDFYIARPGVTIHLYFLPHIEALDFNASEVQAAIYVGLGGWHDLTIDLLKTEELVVIANPLLSYAKHRHSEQRVRYAPEHEPASKLQGYSVHYSHERHPNLTRAGIGPIHCLCVDLSIGR